MATFTRSEAETLYEDWNTSDLPLDEFAERNRMIWFVNGGLIDLLVEPTTGRALEVRLTESLDADGFVPVTLAEAIKDRRDVDDVEALLELAWRLETEGHDPFEGPLDVFNWAYARFPIDADDEGETFWIVGPNWTATPRWRGDEVVGFDVEEVD